MVGSIGRYIAFFSHTTLLAVVDAANVETVSYKQDTRGRTLWLVASPAI